jgi:tellurite resistance protein
MLVPLAAVAWADGSLDEKERKAVLNAASERGIKPGTASYTLLETWLKQKPSQKLMDVWKRYTRSIWEQITKEEQVLLRVNIVGRAREVAQAAGGVLGVGSISPQEKAVLEELEKVLS